MQLVVNEDNLQDNEVQEFSSKVRAILIDENNNILVSNYFDVILLPGGKVDEGETIFTAIRRELNEELGEDYQNEELDFFATLNYYQKNYPKVDGNLKNRLVQTHYFIGLYKGIKENLQKLTEKERRGGFRLELVPLETLENMILNHINDNPRNIYFQKELLVILKNYNELFQDIGVKKLELL